MRGFGNVLRLAVLAGVMLALCACQTTVVSSTWRDQSFRKENLGKVFIIALAKNDAMRRQAEDTMAKNLYRYGIESLPSYRFIATGKGVDRGEVIRLVKREGCANVLVAKALDRKNVAVDNPMGVYQGWFPAYVSASGQEYFDVEMIRIETAMYDLESEKLLWAVQTHSELTSSPTDKDIQEWADLVLVTVLGK